MSLRGKPRAKVLLAALVAGAFIIPTTAAASDSAPEAKPAPAEQSTTGFKDAPNGIRIKVGIDKDKLDAMRAEAKKARAEGRKPNFANEPLKMGKTLKDGNKKNAAPDLSLLQGAKLSKKGAAANAAGDAAPAEAGAITKSGPSAQEYVPDPTGGENHQGWVPIRSRPDTDRLDACFNGLGLNEARIYNRYTTCSKYRFTAEYWSVDNSGVPVEHEGDTVATIKVFGQGDAKERRTRVFSEIEKDSVDYQWGPIDDWWTAPGVPFSLMGQCSQDYTTCGAAPSSYTYPWATWDNNPTWAHWDISNNPDKGKGRDKISYNQWYVEMFTDGGGYKTFDRGETPERMQRCDSAGLRDLRGTFPKACIFSEVVPHLTYSTGTNNHHGVSDHIRAAFNNPNNTYPSPVPPQTKKIPGQYTGDPNSPGLHRITEKLHKSTYADNRAHKNGACYGKGKYKKLYEKTGIPVSERPDTSYQDCDEYPFASTLEGAASKKWDFSVKAVNSEQNQEGGRMLRRYYLNDRILPWDETLGEGENDEFYVRIR